MTQNEAQSTPSTPLGGDVPSDEQRISEMLGRFADASVFASEDKREETASVAARSLAKRDAIRDKILAEFAKLSASLRSAREEGARLDWLEAWTKGDTTICPPGNHGGDLHNWLVSQEDDSRATRYGGWHEEREGKTLRDAVDAARTASTHQEGTSDGN